MRYFLLLVLLLPLIGLSQSKVYIRADSAIFEKVGGNTRIVYKAAERDSTGGVVYNISKGILGIKKTRKYNDSCFVIGGDTICVSGSGGTANVFAKNGLNKSGDTIKLGGYLTEHTTIKGAARTYDMIFDSLRSFEVTRSTSVYFQAGATGNTSFRMSGTESYFGSYPSNPHFFIGHSSGTIQMTAPNIGAQVSIFPSDSSVNLIGSHINVGTLAKGKIIKFPGYVTASGYITDTSAYKVLVVDASGNVNQSHWMAGGGGGSGTVTSFTFTDANGFDGTVTNPTTTPTLSLTTTVTDDQVFVSNSGALSGHTTFTYDGTTLRVGSGSYTTPSITPVAKVTSASGVDFEVVGSGYARMFFNDNSAGSGFKFIEMMNLSNEFVLSRLNDLNTARTTFFKVDASNNLFLSVNQQLKIESDGEMFGGEIDRSSTTSDSAMVVNASTGEWEMRPITGSGGGVTSFTDGNGFDGTVTGSALSLTTTISDRRVFFSNAGAIGSAATFLYNSGDELQVGSATDHGAFKLQVTGDTYLVGDVFGDRIDRTGTTSDSALVVNASTGEWEMRPISGVGSGADGIDTELAVGQSLTTNRSIPTVGNTLTISTSTAAANPLTVSATTGKALIVSGTTGTGIEATVTGTNYPAEFIKHASSTTGVGATLSLKRTTSGTATNGIANALDFYTQNASGSLPNSTRLLSTLTDVTNMSEDSKFEVHIMTNGSLTLHSSFFNDGSLAVYTNAAPTASVSNGILLYAEDVAASAELKVRDEAGNIATLSPHSFTGIPFGRSESMAWAFYGERDGQYINVDMLALAREVEKLTGKKLVFTGSTMSKPNLSNK